MSFRLWYPQLDAYDAIRRVATLLREWTLTPPSLERLYILDFYMANPPLLHRTYMSQPIRDAFQALRIDKPDKTFLKYPASQILFHKMESVQRQAIQNLLGKGLLSPEAYSRGTAWPSQQGMEVFGRSFLELTTEKERSLVKFLTTSFATIGSTNASELHRSTGLRRIN